MKWKFWTRPVEADVMDLGDDPLDPHGDGTIREGDPMYDLMMGGTVFAERRADGQWDVSVEGDE
jgi:hypothetical protein